MLSATTFQSGNRAIRLLGSEPSGPGPHPAILLLHGSGGNLSFWFDRVAPLLPSLGVALFAVHYFDRTGTTRATPAEILDGHHVPLWLATVADTLDHIAARPNVDPDRIALLGVSLGAFLALAYPTLPGARRPRAIVEVSGGLVDPYASQARANFPPTLIVHGEQDTVVPVAQAHALQALLATLGVPHQAMLLPHEGHWFSPAAQLRILQITGQFLRKHL